MTTEQHRNLSVRRRERERTRTDHPPVETQQPEQLVDNQYRITAARPPPPPMFKHLSSMMCITGKLLLATWLLQIFSS